MAVSNHLYLLTGLVVLVAARVSGQTNNANSTSSPTCYCNCAPVINVMPSSGGSTCPSSNSSTNNPVNPTPTTTTRTPSPTPCNNYPVYPPPQFNNDDCQYTLSADSGWFISPFYPNAYPDYANCTWLITSSRPIALFFSEFNLETNYDFVTVYNGPTTTSGILSRSTGTAIPAPIRPISNSILVTFTSDISVRARGFYASFSVQTVG